MPTQKKLMVLLFFLLLLSLYSTLAGGGKNINPFHLPLDPSDHIILFELRLPRVLLAILIGGSLSLSGFILQILLKNPLADPYILGISSGSTLFAVLALLLGAGVFGIWTLSAAAFFGAILSTAALSLYSIKRGQLDQSKLLLSGVGLSFLAQGFLLLCLHLFPNQEVKKMVGWLTGDLSLADSKILYIALPLFLFSLLLISLRAKSLPFFMLGDEIAKNFGVPLNRERLFFFLITALLTSLSVSIGGMVGFVGLIIPHLSRFLLGYNHRTLIIGNFLIGSLFLVFTDFLSRTVSYPLEIPLGVFTSLIGAPYFLYLLRKSSHVLM